ncbi:MAG: NUDIX domain-containing protein [Candidatus Doudnabacteria bacterium]|nr:NUDIX domain-containing protein [Candidatus Doudnabacteria bacterium]
MTQEIFDLYDEEDKPLNKTKPRSEVHKNGDWHRVVHIYVYNEQGQVMVHLRSLFKDSKPGCFDARFGGHVTTGMDYLDTALLELRQEIGLVVRAEELQIGPKEKNAQFPNNEHVQVYFYCFRGNEKDLRFSDQEVVEAKWMNKEEVINSMNSDPQKWAGTAERFLQVFKLLAK